MDKLIIKEYLNNLSELVKPEEVDLSSFETQKILNPEIWDTNSKLKPEIRKQLLKIADDYMDSLDIPWVEYSDVILTGSLANYNWSKFSDVDLHVVINKNEVSDNPDLAEEYLAAKKEVWNNQHNIKIHGFDVELYAQDAHEKHTSSGVYSVENDKWIIVPSIDKPKIDKNMIKKKASQIMSKIDEIIKLNSKGKHTEVLEQYEVLWDKIKKMRQAGLDRAGEFSYENIVFKVLRRTDYIEKLKDIKVDSYDKLNSIK